MAFKMKCVCVLHSRFGQKVSSFLLKLDDTDVNVHTKQQYNNTLFKPHNVSLIIYLHIIMHNTTTIYCSSTLPNRLMVSKHTANMENSKGLFHLKIKIKNVNTELNIFISFNCKLPLTHTLTIFVNNADKCLRPEWPYSTSVLYTTLKRLQLLHSRTYINKSWVAHKNPVQTIIILQQRNKISRHFRDCT